MSKNIVVLSDGTGQEGGRGHDSNIYKLFRMLEDRTDRQIVFYDEGLGTDWRKVTGNAFGAGFSENLLQCYQFIFDNYNAGDKIYLFGFSRGAATVRSLASFIHFFGILPRSRPELIKKAYKLYQRGQDEVSSGLVKQTYNLFTGGQGDQDSLNKKATEFVHEHPNQWAQIEFLGVWDTVPALGLVALAGLNTFLGKILRFNFHNFKLHPSVKNAYHALSIDDDRLWFHPSLWTEKTREEQIVEQIWFSGAHTDIGGGFNEPGLSDIALEWMLEKAASYGLRIYLDSREYWNFVVAPDATDLYHPPRTGFGKIFKKGPRNKVWTDQGATAAFGYPIIHRSVLERHKRSVHEHSHEPEQEDDRNPWILKEATKSSIFFREGEFKKFLSQKFYETLKYEWKKYDWENDRHQTKKFDEWIQDSKYKEYYDSYEWDFHKVYMEDGYKQYCIKCYEENEKSDSRSQWMEKNPYSNDKNLKPEWLSNYPHYQEWLKEYTLEHDNQVYYVEPFKKLAFEKLEAVKSYKPVQDVDEGKKGAQAKDILSLRDYDEDSLAEIMKDEGGNPIIPIEKMEVKSLFRKSFTVVKMKADENKKAIDKIDFNHKRMIKRGRNGNKKKPDRILYDLNRWAGSDETYNQHFALKKTEDETG